jgi:hypothetical protein
MQSQVQPISKGSKYLVKDRQWDARFNSEDEESDALLVMFAKRQPEGRFRYLFIGGPEIGTNPKQDDFGIRHVHLCILLHNPVARSTILSMFGITKGYYLVSRNRALPYSGWRNHHAKITTKVDPTKCDLLELGELPPDVKGNFTLRSEEEKKRKIDDVLVDIRDMLKKQKTEDEIFEMYPRNWMQYGEKVKAMMVQRKDFFKANGDPHIWLCGRPGSGKSSLIHYVYPDAYSKCLYNRFFDLYDPTKNLHVIIEDLDHAAADTLGLNFIKTLADESGFTYDQKYKAAQPARTVCIVTSQFTPTNIIGGLEKQQEVGSQRQALNRRFWVLQATEMQRILGIKLRTSYELRMLKQEGNMDSGKCYMAWNYVDDMPAM